MGRLNILPLVIQLGVMNVAIISGLLLVMEMTALESLVLHPQTTRGPLVPVFVQLDIMGVLDMSVGMPLAAYLVSAVIYGPSLVMGGFVLVSPALVLATVE